STYRLYFVSLMTAKQKTRQSGRVLVSLGQSGRTRGLATSQWQHPAFHLAWQSKSGQCRGWTQEPRAVDRTLTMESRQRRVLSSAIAQIRPRASRIWRDSRPEERTCLGWESERAGCSSSRPATGRASSGKKPEG